MILFLFSFSKSWGQAVISTTNTAVTETFTGYLGTSTLPANWTTSGSGANGNTFQGTNQAGGSSGGWYGNNNMSYLGSGTASNGNATWKLINNTCYTITSFTLTYTVRMWKSGSNSPTASVSYSNNTSGTIPAAGILNLIQNVNDATPSIASGTTITNVVSSISIPAGDFIYLRFIHAGGSNSDNIGWDDVSISVDGTYACGAPHIVTFNNNGGTGTMSNQTASSNTNLTSNAFTNNGCTFVNWNDSANANGTSYANNAVYSFTADVTLYAQWNCANGGGSAGCPYLVSAVVNACAGSCGAEGKNEIVVMNSGSYAIPVNGSNINLYYSGGTNHYFTNSFAAASGTVVSNLNTMTAVSGCTNTPFIFVPSGGTIPANSNFMMLNNNSCFNGDFSAYCNTGPVYVIISTDADWSAGGYFGNNNTPRYFRTDFSNVNSGCGLTTYNYNNPSSYSFGADGASVTFNGTTPSYVNGNGTCAPSIIILPIELIDFYVTQDGAKNDLIWKVAAEKNVLQYIIEKSDDGVNFTELSRAKANNNESANQIYQVEDNSPNSGITYYRLSTLENSNEINHYKIIEIDRENKDWNSLLYQNNNYLIVEFKKSVPKNTTVSLYDLSGRILTETIIKDVQTEINVSDIATGIYFVKIQSPYKTENFKIMIQK